MALSLPEVARSSTYALATQLFLRVLGLIYTLAFASIWLQLDALIGTSGISPAGETLAHLHDRYGAVEAFFRYPSLFWIHTSDGALHATCAIGVISGLLVTAGVMQKPLLIALWTFYLSLVNIADPFLSFQWDALLLETGFVSIFLPRWRAWCAPLDADEPAKAIRWCLYFLLFRLMFASGMVKLLSGDETWRSLTALQFHYETQPLPTWLGWWMHQLPAWAHLVSVLVMLVIELIVPWLIWAPARYRRWAVAPLVFLQLLIFITGNYGFFNLLAVALCLPLIDDEIWRRMLPARFRDRFDDRVEIPMAHWRKLASAATAVPILALSSFALIASLVGYHQLPVPLRSFAQRVAAFNTFNPYGLFAAMTTDRPEIILEGSHDGVTWREYDLMWKPGDLRSAPRWVQPHMPRVDWQLWFAALDSRARPPWLDRLMQRTIEGTPEVRALYRHDPFGRRRPRMMRTVLYVYRMTTPDQLDAEGVYWRRFSIGPLGDPIVAR
jgi:hypothetical protein